MAERAIHGGLARFCLLRDSGQPADVSRIAEECFTADAIIECAVPPNVMTVEGRSAIRPSTTRGSDPGAGPPHVDDRWLVARRRVSHVGGLVAVGQAT